MFNAEELNLLYNLARTPGEDRIVVVRETAGHGVKSSREMGKGPRGQTPWPLSHFPFIGVSSRRIGWLLTLF